MVDDNGGNVVWESGDNHKGSLSAMFDKYQGPENVIVIEDDKFNSKNKVPKIYAQGDEPMPAPVMAPPSMPDMTNLPPV